MNPTGKVVESDFLCPLFICVMYVSNLHTFFLSCKSEEEEEDNCEFRLMSDGESNSEKVSGDMRFWFLRS